MDAKLTEGALLSMLTEESVQEPVLQIISNRRIIVGDKERFRLLLSDGKYKVNNAMVTGVSDVKNFSLIKAIKYHCSEFNTNSKVNKVLLLVKIQVLNENLSDVIGDPAFLSEEMIKDHQSNKNKPPVNGTATTKRTEPEKPSFQTTSLNQTMSDTRVVSEISALTPYYNKWVIKAKVANKSTLRTWSNSKGEGKLFSFDLVDNSGEIRCTAFRDLADKYYNYIEVNKVYFISKCQVKPANKQFNTLKNDYEMTMGSESIIEECLNDDGSDIKINFNFVPLAEIANHNVDSVIDVIGVCKTASDVVTLMGRNVRRELKKRDVSLVDQSQTAISLALWGTQAEEFDGTNNPVIVIRGAKVGEFGGGKTLSTVMSTQLMINPDIPECYRLKGWYDQEGQHADIKNLSERTGSGSLSTKWISLSDIQDLNLGHSEKGDYFQVVATVLLVRSENAVYKACPTSECNKKVIDLENGMYRCEKCNREYPNFKYRLLVSMNIGDFSGNQWVSMFSTEAEKVLGKTSQEIGLALEDKAEAANMIFQEANFKQFIFKCRAKVETYNDEKRLKVVVVNVENVDPTKHNSHLIEEIEQLSKNN